MSLAGSNRKPALTAAASKIRYSRVDAQKLKEAPWQERAWQVYELEGSIYFMTRYRSAVARKIDYYAATVDNPGDDPDIDATFNEDGELLAFGAASKVLDVEGGPELIRRIVSELMVHWDVPGEAYLTRFEEEPLWRILSTQELRKSGIGYFWGDDQNRMGSIDSDQVYRVWKAHPRFHWEADSPTKHILEDAEELILLRRELKARSQSRLPAGAWVLPDTVDMSPFADDEEGTPDDFGRELTSYMTQSVKDPGSAASLVPWIITVDREDHAAVVGGFVKFDRDWDINIEHRDALLRSIATGLDVPPEILTGMADLNHWSAWLVSEQAVSQHVAPTVDDILDSLTTSWFRPLLMAGGMGADQANRYVLWRDLSPATVPPDQSDVAIRLNELEVISDEATRRVTNFDEEDAPSPEELERKAARKAVAGQDIPTDGPPSITAAARPSFAAEEPARIDSDLLAWVVEAAHTEIERLLQIAEDAAITAAADPLDESMLDAFAARLSTRIDQAQDRVKAWLFKLTGAQATIGGETARNAGVAVVVAAILTAVRTRLFTPGATPDPIDLGEIPDVAVPVKQIRDGLSIAGGGLPLFEGEKAFELIGNGKDALDVLEARGFRTSSFRWDYGFMPRQEFPPHKALDGREFDSWDSEALNVSSEAAWLKRAHYKPGDHAGCLCQSTRILTLSLRLPVAASL